MAVLALVLLVLGFTLALFGFHDMFLVAALFCVAVVCGIVFSAVARRR